MTTAFERRQPVARFELAPGGRQVRDRDQYVIELQSAFLNGLVECGPAWQPVA